MPHYKDGTPAQIGDVARGKGYNYPYEVQGIVTRVVPDTGSCDITVSLPKHGFPIDPAAVQAAQFAVNLQPGAVTKLDDGRLLPVSLDAEHGTCADFELVYRPEVKTNGALV